MKFLLLLPFAFFLFTGFSDVVGNYAGTKDDYITEIKLYDDSTFAYTASRDYPFEVSEGNWMMKGDTVVLNTTPCKNPEALNHPPIRTYITFTGEKYLFKKNALIPIVNNKPVKGDQLQKQE